MLKNMVSVRRAATPEDFRILATLIKEFSEWHRASHQQDLELIKRYFDEKAFESELADLKAKYEVCLLATWDTEFCGCVALKRLNDNDCEMKRMFVRPQFQGKGIGAGLGHAIIECAQEAGYRRMLLDTSIRQTAAQSLYRKLGFFDTKPYYEMPREVEDWLVFMERPL